MKKIYKTDDGRIITSLDELEEKDETIHVVTYHDESDLPREMDLTIRNFPKRVFLYAVRALMDKNEKIQAIRFIRAYTGWGLADSKQFVEGLEQPKRYKCDVLFKGRWEPIEQKTVEEAINLLGTYRSICLDGVTLWKLCQTFGVTDAKENTVVEIVSKEGAIQAFREQFI